MYIEIGVQNLLYLNNINVNGLFLNGPIIAPYDTSFFK
jgi:hypothetical protein